MRRYKNLVWLPLSVLVCLILAGCKEDLDGVNPLKWSVESCNSTEIKVLSNKKSGDVNIKAKASGEVVLKGMDVDHVYICCIYVNHEKLDYKDPGFYEDYHNGYEDRQIKVSVTGDNMVTVTIKERLTDTNYIIAMDDGLPTRASDIIIEP